MMEKGGRNEEWKEREGWKEMKERILRWNVKEREGARNKGWYKKGELKEG